MKIPVLMLGACLGVMSVVGLAQGKANKQTSGDGVKTMSGISILGNSETPKSLYIVPWKNSRVGVETQLSGGLLNESLTPVDKEVFERELDFYDFTHKKN